MADADNDFQVDSDEYNNQTDQHVDVEPVNIAKAKKKPLVNRKNIKFIAISGVAFIMIALLSSLFKKEVKTFNPAADVNIPTSTSIPDPADATNLKGADLFEKERMLSEVEADYANKNIDVSVPAALNLVADEPDVETEDDVKEEDIPNPSTAMYSNSIPVRRGNRIEVPEIYMKKMIEQINGVYDGTDKLFAVNEVVYDYKPFVKDEPNDDVITTWDDARNNYPYQLPYLEVIPGMMILGHNSDLGKEMIVEILTGDYRGARLFGSVSNGTYIEKAYMKFKTMYYKNEMYDIEAIAVDPNTNIPAVDGKVKKHWTHNIVYGFGIGFLNAFAAKRKIDSIDGGVNIPLIGNIGSSVTNGDALLESEALGAAGSTLSSLGQYRKPTFIKNAYGSVGIVFITTNTSDGRNNDNHDEDESSDVAVN